MACSLSHGSGAEERFVEITKADHDLLYEAIEEGDEEIVKGVLDKVPGIVTTLSDKHFCFYLHLACMHNQASICERLIRYGADVNQRDDQQDTPLHLAVSHETSLELIRNLLNHGANVSSQNQQRLSPFQEACIAGSHEHIKELIKYAKRPLNEIDVYGKNGLHLALQNWNKFGTSEALLDSITLIVNAGVDLNAQDYDGWSVLHHASYYLGLDFIPRLLEMGVDPFLQDSNGDTFMTVCASTYIPNEFNKIIMDLVEQLENEECKVIVSDVKSTVKLSEKFINMQNLSGKSIFHLFLDNMELTTLKFLLDKGVDVCLQDNVGRSPLHLCSALGDGLEKLKLLIEYEGKTNSRDVHGRSPLYEVTECDATQLLIDHGSDPNTEDKLGMSPLHTAALDHRPDVIKVLLRNGALVNKQDIYGSTALHYASWWNFETIIDLLKTSGADSTIEDQNGNTAARLQATDQLAQRFRIQDLISPGLQQAVICLPEKDTDITKANKGGLSGTDFAKALLSTPRLGLLSDVGEACHVKQVVFELVSELLRFVTKLDARFEGRLFPTGSSSEGTRVGEPDEFDFLYFLEIFEKECDICEVYYYLTDGFVQLKSNNVKSFSCAKFFDGNGFLNGDLVRTKLRKLLEIAINQSHIWNSNEMFFFDFTNDYTKPVLNLEVRYIGSFFKTLEISIDIVPAVYKKPWWPSIVAPESFKLMTHTIRDAGCAVLLQNPSMNFETDDDNDNYMRISCAPAEIALFKLLPAYMKKSYALIKVLLRGDVCPPVIDKGVDGEETFPAGYYISSYMIKNCLLHEVGEMDDFILTSLLSGEMCVVGNEQTCAGKQSTSDGRTAVLFEDLYENNDSDFNDTVSFAKKILLRFRDGVQKGSLPAYFMPSVNVLGYEYRVVYGEEPEVESKSIQQKEGNRKIIISNLLDFLEKC